MHFVTNADWANFLNTLAGWQSFITLTYRPEQSPSREKCYGDWRNLVAVLNKGLYGRHYQRKVGVSYFSYALALELNTSDIWHMHALVDDRIDYESVHRYWGLAHGHAWIKVLPKDYDERARVVKYVCKYISKAGEPMVWRRREYRPPPVVAPDWYTGQGFKRNRVAND